MDAKKLIEDWVRGLPRLTRGDIAGGLVLLEHLRKNFALDINAHKASGSDQLKGGYARRCRRGIRAIRRKTDAFQRGRTH